MRRKTDVRMAALAAAAFCAAVLAALAARPVPRLLAGHFLPTPGAVVYRTAVPGPAVEESLRDALNSGPASDPLEREALAAAAAGRLPTLRAEMPRLRDPRYAEGASASARHTTASSQEPARGDAPSRRARQTASVTEALSNGPSGGRAAARRGGGSAQDTFASTERRTQPSPPRAGHEAPSRAAAALPRLAPFERERAAADARRAANGKRLSSPRESPLFAAMKKHTARKERADEPAASRESKPARFHPLTLSGLLGRRALHPPPSSLQPPSALAALSAAAAPVAAVPAGLAQVEAIDPARLGHDRRAGAHWDGDQWHSGSVRGVENAGTWTWLYHETGHWWASAGREQLLRRDGLWWTKQNGVWFVVHDGEPWAVRPFHDWEAEGLFHPATGTEMVYSRDFTKVAVVTPGHGAVVFDAATGAELGAIPEDQMPARRRPRAPERLPLPKDVFAR
jgi:hypothetical protein